MGVYLSTPKTLKISEDGENDVLKFGLSAMQGWRTSMEDAHTAFVDVEPDTSFFGVFDGHGGREVAHFCAKYLHTQILKGEAYISGDLAAAVQRAYLRIDEMMKGRRGWRELAAVGDKMSKFTGLVEGVIWSPKGNDTHEKEEDWPFEQGPHWNYPGPRCCGSTACTALIKGSKLIVGNAGDSRCVLSRNGQAIDLSRDHKPGVELEKERIQRAGGFVRAGRINGCLGVSRALGDMEFKKNKFLSPEKQIVTAYPDVESVEICEEDEFIVIACDGIWDCMSSQQLVDFIHEHINTEEKLSGVCERLLDRCLAPSAGVSVGCDNMTMILIQFKKPTEAQKSGNGDAADARVQ